MIPVISGSKGKSYVIDHHHLTRALIAEGVENILVNVLADLSRLKKSEFWVYCDNCGWCHPYDATGKRVRFSQISASLKDMTDDPHRSLAGALRRAGGSPRTRPLQRVHLGRLPSAAGGAEMVQTDFEAALDNALKLARSTKAQHLPGWCGSTS